MRGIIPARAGFTISAACAPLADTDHPRSRGVYDPNGNTDTFIYGSSPLARGLRPLPSRVISVTRIIPARAGFTDGSGQLYLRTRDHPRSRGVYPPSPWDGSLRCGSSPLARGLPRGCRARPRLAGIIPARAGFTGSENHSQVNDRDHPRSRGVYVRGLIGYWSAQGSSPLARGLPLTRAPGTGQWRIIPARAGFTDSYFSELHSCSDHPRSRGVYAPWGLLVWLPRGSSPLARGLQPRRGQARRLARIIPARAGFTLGRMSRLGHTTDHPRSRGVYVRSCQRPPAFSGSSPLARGLLSSIIDLLQTFGIIPARAGFTQRRSFSGRSGPGSSPLARGLRSTASGTENLERIIPARAGFTSSSSGLVWSGGDHPRSRGVYVDRGAQILSYFGSSPLARGLPPLPSVKNTNVRIIPARAGFTGADSLLDGSAADHPRSRGVYVRVRCASMSRTGIIPARAGFTNG